MNSVRTGTFKSSLLVAIASWVVNDHAWAQTMPSPVMPPATAQPAAEGGGAAIAAVGAVVGLLVVIGIVAKLFDLKQKRESEVVQLQAQLSDALLALGRRRDRMAFRRLAAGEAFRRHPCLPKQTLPRLASV